MNTISSTVHWWRQRYGRICAKKVSVQYLICRLSCLYALWENKMRSVWLCHHCAKFQASKKHISTQRTYTSCLTTETHTHINWCRNKVCLHNKFNIIWVYAYRCQNSKYYLTVNFISLCYAVAVVSSVLVASSWSDFKWLSHHISTSQYTHVHGNKTKITQQHD